MKKEIILKVPLIKQSGNGCAVACLQMLLEYSQDPVSYENLEQELLPILNDDNIGITPATARILAQRGHKVFFKTYMLELLDQDLVNKSENDIEYFKKRIQSNNFIDAKVQKQWEQMALYIEAGGKFNTTIATLKDINQALEKGMPVRISVAPKAIVPDSKFLGHAVVVCGRKDDAYLINDPATRFTEPYYLHKDTLLYAWYQNGGVIFGLQN